MSNAEFRIKIKTVFANWENYEQRIHEKQVHVITFAEEGKSVFMTTGHFYGNIDGKILSNYCYQANRMHGYITLFPLMNLSAIARQFFRKEMSDEEKIKFEKIVKSIFILDTKFIKSKHLIFDFTCAVHNKEFIKNCIKSVAREFEKLNSIIEICEIRFDKEIFVNK